MSLLRRRKAEDLTQLKFRSQHQKKKKNRRGLEVLWRNSKVLHSYEHCINFKSYFWNRNQGSFRNFHLICNNIAPQNKSWLLLSLKSNDRHENDVVFDLNDTTALNQFRQLLSSKPLLIFIFFIIYFIYEVLYLSS